MRHRFPVDERAEAMAGVQRELNRHRNLPHVCRWVSDEGAQSVEVNEIREHLVCSVCGRTSERRIGEVY